MTYSHMHVMSDIVPPSSSSYAATSLTALPLPPTIAVYSDTDSDTDTDTDTNTNTNTNTEARDILLSRRDRPVAPVTATPSATTSSSTSTTRCDGSSWDVAAVRSGSHPVQTIRYARP